jgi:hypothetical protein
LDRIIDVHGIVTTRRNKYLIKAVLKQACILGHAPHLTQNCLIDVVAVDNQNASELPIRLLPPTEGIHRSILNDVCEVHPSPVCHLACNQRCKLTAEIMLAVW